MAEAKAFKMIPHCTKDTITYEMDELIRCKDCKFWYKDECSHLCAITGDLRPKGWYCADAERGLENG